VTAGDIQGAVEASRGILGDGKQPDKLNLKGGKASLWAAIYFGTSGSSPPAWRIETVEVRDRTVRVAYRKGAADTDDIHYYLSWVPVPAGKAGTYTLELFDAAEGKVTLKRQVKVVVK
jgi:hypothetical protein